MIDCKKCGVDQNEENLNKDCPHHRQCYKFLNVGDFARAEAYANKILELNPECSEAYFIKFLAIYKIKNPKNVISLNFNISSDNTFIKALKFADDDFRATLDSYAQANLKYQEQLAEREQNRKKENKSILKKILWITSIIVLSMALISYLGGYLLIKSNHDELDAEVNSRNGLILQKIDGGYTVSGLGQNETATEIVIPSSYKGGKIIAIEKNVFKNCSSITSVTLSDNLTQIGESAFENCSSLTTLKIGTKLTSIGSCAFKGTKLKNVYFSDINEWVQINGVSNITSYGASYKDLYLNDVLVTEVNIDKATSVNPRAFYNCTNVTNITLGTQLKKIDEYAFSGCQIKNIYYAGDINEWVQIDGLKYLMVYGDSSKKLYLNNQLLTNEVKITTATAVKDSAFYGYYSLSKVILSDSVTSLGDSVFSNCNLLTNLTIGKNLKKIGKEAFYNSEIENIYLQDVNQWAQIDGLDSLMKYGSTDKNIYVNNVLLTEANFSSATTISSYAFYGYKKLTEVTFGEQVTLIGTYAFLNCSSLSNAYFTNPNGWFTTLDPTEDNTNILTLNDPSKNANNLRYANYGTSYLKRNQNA